MTPLAFRLDGKNALITGGGTGIGRGIAEMFAAAGARVVVAGRRAEPLAETVAAIGPAARAIPADVALESDRARLLERTLAELGALDILVNCAGVSVKRPVQEMDAETWERVLRVNLIAVLELSRAALPELKRRRGSILSISTGASLHPVPGFGAYGASKAGLNYASQVLAMEAAPEVRANLICPGGVDTPIFESFVDREQIPEVLRRFRERTPLGRIGQPADVAAAALYLCSDAAEWVTGAMLTVDGGLNLG